ncbi:PorP/SprF family type IX secretion system membrane protein [Pedobacter sp. MW01-1-1]|uniref:PorP/SprF family type IX secretion system membrane protein n=1 Tax=Pedobacter sp. MW01-1-1 TaxID=3383027 RepID=UPI003FEDF97F
MKKIVFLTYLSLFCISVKAQITPPKSQFFQNPYLINPAMAGYQDRGNVFMDYSSQMNRLPGGPVLMSLSASTPLSKKAAIGLNFQNDKAGLLSTTEAMASFSYKVSFSEEQALRFGISLSWAQDKVDLSEATASSVVDPDLARNRNQESYMDGNFGIAYLYNGFEAQFSYLNLNAKRISQFSTVDYATFYSSVSYLIPLNNGFSVKPLFAYRGLKDLGNQFDVAAEWRAKELIFYTMYHSNKTFTGGLGIDFNRNLHIAGWYNTAPSTFVGLSGGIFDVVVGLSF